MEPRSNTVPASYVDALAALNGKPRRRVPSIRNTWLVLHEDGSIGLLYKETSVITYREDGTVSLDSGCYRQRTTKTRMNQVLTRRGCRVKQVAGKWVLTNGSITTPFVDGQVVALPVQPLPTSARVHTSVLDHGWSDIGATCEEKSVPAALTQWPAALIPGLDEIADAPGARLARTEPDSPETVLERLDAADERDRTDASEVA